MPLNESINAFINERIWKTKKIRMEAEVRMKRNSLLATIITNYYTFIILAFSIWALILDSKNGYVENISLISVIVSVGLFGVSLLFSSLGFSAKASQYRDSYLRLESLENEVRLLLNRVPQMNQEEIVNKLFELEQKYNEVISLSENHSTVDYEKVMINRKLTGYLSLRRRYYFKIWMKYLLIGIIFTLPIILVFLLIIK